MSLVNYLSEWVSLRSSGLAPRTVESYRHLIDAHIAPSMAAVDLAELSPRQIQSLLADLCARGHSRTAQLCYCLIHAALADGVRNGLFASNAADRVLRPRHRRSDPRFWSPEEIGAFAHFCDISRWGVAWLLALFCGLRRGELAGLRWSDVDLQRRILHIRNQRQRLHGVGVVDSPPKSAAGVRDIPIPDGLVSVLRRENRRQKLQQAQGGLLPVYVVCGVDNRPIDPHRLNLALSRDISKSGLRPINLHGLRHSMATAAVAAGVPIKVLQELLGHASFSVTADTYAHVLQSEKITAIDNLFGSIYNASM